VKGANSVPQDVTWCKANEPSSESKSPTHSEDSEMCIFLIPRSVHCRPGYFVVIKEIATNNGAHCTNAARISLASWYMGWLFWPTDLALERICWRPGIGMVYIVYTLVILVTGSQVSAVNECVDSYIMPLLTVLLMSIIKFLSTMKTWCLQGRKCMTDHQSHRVTKMFRIGFKATSFFFFPYSK
jgi:hypothetical protein